MNHVLFPMMHEMAFPEDTSFAVFEEDWCLCERHALIREVRTNNLFRPFLAQDYDKIKMLKEAYAKADQEIDDPKELVQVLARLAKENLGDLYHEPGGEHSAATPRDDSAGGEEGEHSATARAGSSAEGEHSATEGLWRFISDPLLPRPDKTPLRLSNISWPWDCPVQDPIVNRSGPRATAHPGHGPLTAAEFVRRAGGSAEEQERMRQAPVLDVNGEVLCPPKWDPKDTTPWPSFLLQLCGVHTQAHRCGAGNVVFFAVVTGRGSGGAKKSKGQRKLPEEQPWNFMYTGWKMDYPGWGTMGVFNSKAGARVVHGFMQAEASASQRKFIHYGHFDRTIQAFLETPADAETIARIKHLLAPPDVRKGDSWHPQPWIEPLPEDEQSMFSLVSSHLGASYLFPPIGNMCSHLSSSDINVKHERPGHFDHASVAQNLDQQFMLGVFVRRQMLSKKPEGWRYLYNPMFSFNEPHSPTNRRYVHDAITFSIPPKGLLWTTAIPAWIRNKEELDLAVAEEWFFGHRVPSRDGVWTGPTDHPTEDLEAVFKIWNKTLPRGTMRARFGLVKAFWKWRCFSTSGAEAYGKHMNILNPHNTS